MFCRYCGYKLPDNTNFCTECGKITDTQPKNDGELRLDVTAQPQEAMNFGATALEDPFLKQKNALGGKILTFAIIGMALSFTLYGSLVGLIFSIIALATAKKYTKLFNSTVGRASVGKGLGIAALVLNAMSFISMIYTIVVYIVEMLYPGSSGGGGGSNPGITM